MRNEPLDCYSSALIPTWSAGAGCRRRAARFESLKDDRQPHSEIGARLAVAGPSGSRSQVVGLMLSIMVWIQVGVWLILSVLAVLGRYCCLVPPVIRAASGRSMNSARHRGLPTKPFSLFHERNRYPMVTGNALAGCPSAQRPAVMDLPRSSAARTSSADPKSPTDNGSSLSLDQRTGRRGGRQQRLHYEHGHSGWNLQAVVLVFIWMLEAPILGFQRATGLCSVGPACDADHASYQSGSDGGDALVQ
jgi:hypothetical protein